MGAVAGSSFFVASPLLAPVAQTRAPTPIREEEGTMTTERVELLRAAAALAQTWGNAAGDPSASLVEVMDEAADELDQLCAENERLREALRETAQLAQTVHDLTGHWSECPAPPDADCDLCHDYYAAVAALAASLSETGGEPA